MTHAAYAQAGTALMIPVQPPVGRLHRDKNEQVTEGARRGGSRFVGFYRKACSDFLGVLGSDGRALAVELKSVSGDRWYLSKLPAHQATSLERGAMRGGLAYLLIVYFTGGDPSQAVVAKWPAFRDELAARGLLHQGLAWSTLASTLHSAAAVPERMGTSLDYLQAIAAIEERVHETMASVTMEA